MKFVHDGEVTDRLYVIKLGTCDANYRKMGVASKSLTTLRHRAHPCDETLIDIQLVHWDRSRPVGCFNSEKWSYRNQNVRTQ
jgi:hypothetical protein